MFICRVILLLALINLGSARRQSRCKQGPGRREYLEFYNRETGKCYPAGEQGPCGKYMVWLQRSRNSRFGICSCIPPDTCSDNLQRPVARWRGDGQCYLAYEQGPCQFDEWLVFDRRWRGVCEINQCVDFEPEVESVNENNATQVSGQNDSFNEFKGNNASVEIMNDDGSFNFWYNGKCFSNNKDQGPCKNGQVFGFLGTNPNPTCINPKKKNSCGSNQMSTLQCPTGFRRRGRDCVPRARNDNY